MTLRLRRSKAKEGTLAKSYAELRLLSALPLDGCPICHETSGLDDSYFFWWFNERYMEPFSLDALTRSLGFCSAHAAWLVRAPLGAFQLAAVHRVLARRIHDALRSMAQEHGRLRLEASALAGSGVCPPCQSRQQSAAHCAFWTPRILEDPVERERYGGPGLLCFRHAGILAHVLRYSQSFVWGYHGAETDEDRAALSSAVGWCSGWQGLLARFR